MESNRGRFPRPKQYSLPFHEVGPAMRDEKLGGVITDICGLWENTVAELGKHGQGSAYYSPKVASAIYLELLSMLLLLEMPAIPDPKHVVRICGHAEKEREKLLAVGFAQREVQ